MGKGTIKNIIFKIELGNLPWLEKIELWVKPGDVIDNINSHGARSGVFVVSGTDREDVNKKIKYIYQNVEFIYD